MSGASERQWESGTFSRALTVNGHLQLPVEIWGRMRSTEKIIPPGFPLGI
jgi:hypothetical protein